MPTLKEIQAARHERARGFAALYREGKTLEEIGALHGITRERVRQLISEIGVSSQEGGNAVRSRFRKVARKAGRELTRAEEEEACIQRHGVTVAQRHALQKTPSWQLYRAWRKNHSKDGRLLYPEWLEVWGGPRTERPGPLDGDSYDRPAICRFDASRPYEKGNVFIGTFSLSISQSKTANNRRKRDAA